MMARFFSAFALVLILAPGPGAAQSQAEIETALAALGYGAPSGQDAETFDRNLAIRQYQADDFAPVTGQLTDAQITDLLVRAAKRRAEHAKVAAETAATDLPAPMTSDETLARVNADIRAEEERVVTAGLVYRSPLYWDGYARRIDIPDIFAGRFGGIHRDSYGFAMLFNAYVVAYSRTCEDHLPPGSAVYEVTQRRQVFDGWGYKTADYTIPIDRIVVHPELQPRYETFRNHPGSRGQWAGQFLQMLNMTGRPMSPADRSLLDGQIAFLLLDPQADFTRFLTREGCSSAPQVQMQSNLLRHASGQPSLQSSGARFPSLPTGVASDGGVLTRDNMQLASRLHISLESLGGAEDKPLPTNAIAQRLVWEGLDFDTFLDARTRDLAIRTGGREIGWADTLVLYNLANRNMRERQRFRPVFFKDDEGSMHVAHMRIGWRGEGINPEVSRVTFTVRPLACAAYRAGLVTIGNDGLQGDNGFALVAQPNYSAPGLMWNAVCNPALQRTFDEELLRITEAAKKP